MQNIAVSVSYLTKSRGTVGLIIDEKAQLKKGTKSAGLSRQYTPQGIIEKIDNPVRLRLMCRPLCGEICKVN